MDELERNNSAADEQIRIADELNRVDELKRKEMLHNIGRMRWKLATQIHELEDGSKLDFDRWAFQREIYQNESPDMVMMGSTGYGKTVFSIMDDFAKAMCGLRVIHVCEKSQKRNAFVLGVVDPIMHRVPFYAGLLKAAAEDRHAEVDSAYAKHFGDGMIIYVGSNAESDFYSYRGDATMVDEHQLCDQDNLAKLFGRRTGSFWRFQTVMGNPKGFGTPENQNIHWQYLLSDQRQWQVPCPYCHEFQKIGWFSHFVEEIRNDYGAIVNVKVRDQEREDQEELEIRPICSYCARPMRRLHPEGRWRAMNPGKRKTGYQLANFYNPDANMNELLGEYRKGLHNPNAMASFINDQTGEPYATAGSNITSEMLQAASTCVSAGIDPYQFVHANELNFQDVDIRT